MATVLEHSTYFSRILNLTQMPAYLVTWTKQGGRLPMTRVTDFEGILHIRRVELSDSGTYKCTGSNMYSTDQEEATLVVLRG